MPNRVLLLAAFSLLFSPCLFSDVLKEIKNLPKEELKRDHFIIYHENRNFANDISWNAEYNYKKILRHLGIADFHPWEKGENKCVILIFKNQKEFLDAVLSPLNLKNEEEAMVARESLDWMGGLARKDENVLMIFEGAKGVENQILPHELSHLILREYFGEANIPLWLNEGMAQYEEEGRGYKKLVMNIVRDNIFLALTDLFKMKSLPPSRAEIALFYVQSASVIDYMRTQLLQTQFSQFLRQLKGGIPTDEALKEVYQWKFPNGVKDFEKRWLEYVKTKY